MHSSICGQLGGLHIQATMSTVLIVCERQPLFSWVVCQTVIVGHLYILINSHTAFLMGYSSFPSSQQYRKVPFPPCSFQHLPSFLLFVLLLLLKSYQVRSPISLTFSYTFGPCSMIDCTSKQKLSKTVVVFRNHSAYKSR